ncbi:1-deoxy-D-xylulose-5-phosphate synthase [Lipingzhangella sp. LS1_29]|uniref:1-deoxy-D-xylulose-5-phosphate synthase n=1 Tax=Lipingzhangella rawalii TaxID=2055835 RepID=A0ABU2HBF3_9ACTN|nr:1-deoxy-D-xylulose-5-phosphate synthase [Lipingzhangella rawalii]MDS1272665.1 1-deoxy-D-xylulose-5-phosphate synthase [Lipingzhangella rawalii]
MTTTTDARRLLGGAADPKVLRELSGEELDALAQQIREFLIEKVAAVGGHLGPNLGAVELTLALHRIFDSPHDTLLFDIGHQAYVHKLLTGRVEDFDTLRQGDGLSGYLSRAESEHDVIENSHASTALAYADGLAKARQLSGEDDRAVVAVIGDGAMSGGMAWEALNNLGGAPERPVIVVLNDNERSYAPTVGGLADHLQQLRGQSDDSIDWLVKNSSRISAGEGTGGPLPVAHSLFELLGFAYLGPVDGHHRPSLEEALHLARELERPVVVHAVTAKGRGYEPAESEPDDRMHTCGVLDPATGAPAKKASAPGWTSVFADEMCALGDEHRELVALTAAMPGPTGLAKFGERFPERFFDVGIAEQHAVTSAAGLATGGLHPVVGVYATFLGRAFDQVLMDVALHRLPVTFVLDRAGITGPDGPSHHGMWDLTLLGAVPGMHVSAPRDAAQLRELLAEAVAYEDGPTALRFPKASAGADIPALERIGQVDVLHRSSVADILIVAAGPLAAPAIEAAEALQAQGIGVTVADPRWALPILPELTQLAARHHLVVTVEDNIRHGGLGAALTRALADASNATPLRALGLPGRFIPHGNRNDLLSQAGLDAEGITQAILRACAPEPFQPAKER